MAYTSKNELTHGLGYGVVFTDPTGSKTGIPIAGLRGIETDSKQENKNFYAGFNAPYRTIAGVKDTQIKVKSYDLPNEFAVHALGFGQWFGFLIDEETNHKPYGFAYAERYRDDEGTGYKATFYPSVQATTPSDTAEADEESPTGKEYEHTATVTTGDFKLGDKKRLFVKFKVSDKDLATGTSGPVLAFKKLFNELKPLTATDIKA
ncbi:major tail protein [Lactococcus phage 74001]|uniref:Major tail protein n=1 Tax=Lactococcus phage 74001 TaxID=2024341 RepID=A0A2Z2RY65_9CAUD|nr:major tail protein [Lactococcus phage 74001]